MPRRRFRDPDPQVRNRNQLEILGSPGLTGLSRIGGRPQGAQQLVVRPPSQGGSVRIEHVTLTAVADQTIADGGGTVQWDQVGDAPTEVRGFDTLMDELGDDGQVGDIPIDVTGELEIVLDGVWESYRSKGELTITRTRSGSTAVRTFDLGPIRSRMFDGVTLGWGVRAGDTITVAVPNDSGSGQTLDEATIGLRVIAPQGATSTVPQPSALPTADLVWHIDASQIDGLSDGGSVTTWEDLGTQSIDASLSNSSFNLPPTYRTGVQNGLAVVRFARGDQLVLESTDSSLGQAQPMHGASAGTMFLVAKNEDATPAGKYGHPVMLFGNNNDSHVPWTDGDVYENWGTASGPNLGRFVFTPPAGVLGSFYLYEVVSASGSYEVKINGTTVFSSASNTPFFQDTATPPRLARGVSDTAHQWGGDVGECVMYGVEKTPEERTEIREFLADKWGISL